VSDTNQINNPIPASKGTVFISYARADDRKFDFDGTTRGWVNFFWDYLRWALTDKGLPQANLWLDRYQIEPAEDFTQKIEQALKEARLIIAIVSPNWVQRPWCRKEVTRFAELNPKYLGDGIVPVRKGETLETELPEPLRNREGYRFYEKDTTGALREFYWNGLKDRDAYEKELKRIVMWIAGRLMSSPPPAQTASVPNGQVVYLARSADELSDAWQRVANDLRGAGHVVLPSNPLPDTAAAAEERVRDALTKSDLSVHFLGDSEGVKPDGTNEGIVRLQLRLAREAARPSDPRPRVLWVPKWLPGHPDTKRDPFDVLKLFGGLVPGEEVYAEEATDLSQMLRARLARSPPKAPDELRVIIAAEPSDNDG